MEHITQNGVEGNQETPRSLDYRTVPNKHPPGVGNKHPPGSKLVPAFEEKLAMAEEVLRDDQMESDPVHLKNLAEEITYALSGLKSLRLSMDHDLKRVVVRVVDKRTNNVVRQIPSEQMVDLVKQMRDLEGLLFKASA